MPRLGTIYDWCMVVRILRSERFFALSQEDFAREAGVCSSTVSKWETAAVVPQLKHRTRLRALALSAGFPQSEWPQQDFKELKAVPSSRPSLVAERESPT
jgi:transcriptional regulator with XRE-family HTH domain